jgi:hypothetical protein
LREDGTPRFHFSREVRLGDVLTIAGVALLMYGNQQRDQLRVENLERGQVAQAVTNKELRGEIREVALTVSQDIKELGKDVRDMRDKINRARM